MRSLANFQTLNTEWTEQEWHKAWEGSVHIVTWQEVGVAFIRCLNMPTIEIVIFTAPAEIKSL